jgi:glutathione S-transferase
MKDPAHLAHHPFGQLPTYEESDLGLFETGAIVFHVAEPHAGLLPDDAIARARSHGCSPRSARWSRRSLNSEPPRSLRATNPGPRNACLSSRIASVTVGQLSRRLGDADWLDGAFSAGDLMMVSVLLRLKASGMLDDYPNLSAYVARGEARPAYKRAFEAQLAVNTGKQPTR